jgi:pimeloyl-ACP methyl ester carboxylesterase
VKIVLLHGALGSLDDFDSLLPFLPAHWEVYRFDFLNHGKGPYTDDPLSIPNFSGQLYQFLEKEQIDRAYIFGYSMGGYAACWLAAHMAERIAAIYTLGTKFIWTPETAQQEIAKLDARQITQQFPAYANKLAEKHQTIDWHHLLTQTAQMMRALGDNPALKQADFQKIQVPVVVARGEKDKMVTQTEVETIAAYLTNAQLEVLPDTPHPIDRVNPEMLSQRLTTFFTSV